MTTQRTVGDRDSGRGADSRPPSSFDAALERDAVTTPSEGSVADAVVDRRVPPDDGQAIPDDSGTSRDARPEASDAAVIPPDCRCPAGSFYVNLNLGGSLVRLSAPFHIGLYCDETAPQLANPPCGSVLRLSACAGPQNAPPCLYVAVDGQTAVAGFFLDSTGQTFELVTGKIELQSTTGRLAIGTFSATYTSRTSEASVTAVGMFHACTTLFRPCGT